MLLTLIKNTDKIKTSQIGCVKQYTCFVNSKMFGDCV